MTLSQKTFLFRYDGAPENDAFFEHARASDQLVYRGPQIKLQRGWIPDFIQVSLTHNPFGCSLTIIELENTDTAALISARKYLLEPSEDILTTFRRYLQQVLKECSQGGDPRAGEIQKLNEAVSGTAPVTLYTAAGLRQPPQIVETFPLIDQSNAPRTPTLHPHKESVADPLDGDLSARTHKNLSRSVLILDAVVRGWDKSDASLRAWRNHRSQPLRHQIKTHPADFPVLAALLLGRKVGLSLRLSDAARELSALWNTFQAGRHSETSVRDAIIRFLPIDRALDPRASVRIAFDKARLALWPG